MKIEGPEGERASFVALGADQAESDEVLARLRPLDEVEFERAYV